MTIVLLGYMGSGKSTVGKALALALGYEFFDLDDLIEVQQKMTIPQIFLEHGEIYFRKLESEVLKDTLKNSTNIVLALGGGTPCYGKNMALLKAHNITSIYLKLSINELVNRLSKEKSERPLIKNIEDDELPEFIGKHLFERSFFYNQADEILHGDKSVVEIITEIKTLI